MNTELWMGKAREKINRITSGTEFVVKDLFEGVEWNTLSKGDRLCFGKYFKNAVSSGQFSFVKYLGKQDNNSAKYMKE